jgi:hypothetical protein
LRFCLIWARKSFTAGKGTGGNEFKHYPICARAPCMQIVELL